MSEIRFFELSIRHPMSQMPCLRRQKGSGGEPHVGRTLARVKLLDQRPLQCFGTLQVFGTMALAGQLQ